MYVSAGVSTVWVSSFALGKRFLELDIDFCIQSKERFRKRNENRKTPKVYYRKYKNAHGSDVWAGGKDLSSTAEYPWAFCRAVYNTWLAEFELRSSHPRTV